MAGFCTSFSSLASPLPCFRDQQEKEVAVDFVVVWPLAFTAGEWASSLSPRLLFQANFGGSGFGGRFKCQIVFTHKYIYKRAGNSNFAPPIPPSQVGSRWSQLHLLSGGVFFHAAGGVPAGFQRHRSGAGLPLQYSPLVQMIPLPPGIHPAGPPGPPQLWTLPSLQL